MKWLKTSPNNEALFLLHVRFIKENVFQKLLFAKTFKANTKRKSIFNTMNNFFQEKDTISRQKFHNTFKQATD